MRVPQQIVGSEHEKETEEEKTSKAELVKKKVLGTWHFREKEEGEYLSDVEWAAEQSQLSAERGPGDHSVHVTVLQLADK